MFRGVCLFSLFFRRRRKISPCLPFWFDVHLLSALMDHPCSWGAPRAELKVCNVKVHLRLELQHQQGLCCKAKAVLAAQQHWHLCGTISQRCAICVAPLAVL